VITLLPRVTVDFELLMKHLLAYPGLSVVPAIDVDSLTELPILAFSGGNGHMISNGFPEAGWEWTLFLTLFTADLEAGGHTADTIYQTVHGMEGQSVVDVGSVSSVEDESMFDRIGTTPLPDKQIVQYNASFLVRVRP
jgi:hypothetical protein